MIQVMNLEELQDRLNLLDTDNGIAFESVNDTDLFELLQPFLNAVDYRLYFDYANRVVIGKYAKAVENDKLTLVKKAVYYALKSNEYNLRTIIGTLNLDYNPIENYYINEQIKTTASISAFMKYGETSATGTTSYSSFVTETVDDLGEEKTNRELSKPEITTLKTLTHGTVEKEFSKDETVTTGQHTDTLTMNRAEHTDTHNSTDTIAKISSSENTTTNLGERTTDTGVTENVSAYNTSTYQPNTQTDTMATQDAVTDTTSTTKTTDGHTDTHQTTDVYGEHQDKDTNIHGERIDTVTANNGEKTIGYTDTETLKTPAYEDVDITTREPVTNNSTRTENPHYVDSSSKNSAHEDSTDRDENELRNRELHGRYGFTTVQSMIQAERELANVNVVDQICGIIIHTICEGVLFTW